MEESARIKATLFGIYVSNFIYIESFAVSSASPYRSRRIHHGLGGPSAGHKWIWCTRYMVRKNDRKIASVVYYSCDCGSVRVLVKYFVFINSYLTIILETINSGCTACPIMWTNIAWRADSR